MKKLLAIIGVLGVLASSSVFAWPGDGDPLFCDRMPNAPWCK